MSTRLNEIPVEDFAALIGEALPTEAAGQHFALRVEAVEPSPHPSGRGLPGFSLHLRGPAELNLGQGVYAITHPRHGCLQLFITPIRRDPQGLLYEAVFN